MASTKPSRVYGVAFTIVLNWIGSVRLMHAQPWIAHPGPRLGKRFGPGYHRFDKQRRLGHHLTKFGSLAPLLPTRRYADTPIRSTPTSQTHCLLITLIDIPFARPNRYS